jgi:signal transduction histidine kinase
LIALDADATRRATTLQEAWPILSTYLAVGLGVGWLAARERERERHSTRMAAIADASREIAAAVAHEVNNPLQAIALQLQLIADEGLSEPASKRLGSAQEELARIAGIVQRLLDFQRPTPGARVPHDVTALLDDVLALADKQLQQQRVTVVREGRADLEPVLVTGDQMKQVFLNLVLNAVEAMPDGGQLRVCTATSAMRRTCCCIPASKKSLASSSAHRPSQASWGKCWAKLLCRASILF